MKIIFIAPYMCIQALGVRFLSALLKREGHEVKVLFMPVLFTEDYQEETLNEVVDFARGSDLIGISLMTNYYFNAVQVNDRLKKHLNIPIIWGGVHPTVRPEESLEHADIVCIGEGEEAMLELVKRLENNQVWHDVPNLCFKKDGKIVKNDKKPLVRDLDSLPFQDYDYKTHHIVHDHHIVEMTADLMRHYLDSEYLTLATRGCPFACTFCFVNAFNNMYEGEAPMRKRTMDNVIRELMEVKENLPLLTTIKFDDDNFFSYSTKEIEYFSSEYKKKIGLPLIITGATPQTVNKEQLSHLVDAGLRGLRMGIQSAADATKKLYKRGTSNRIVRRATDIINGFGKRLVPQYDIIIDNPYEGEKEQVDTLMLLSELPVPYNLQIYSLTFYPGTELYDLAKKDGLIKDDHLEVYRKYYHTCQKTYLNSLFFLIERYAQNSSRIPPFVMSLMTHITMRRLGLGYVVCGLMWGWTVHFFPKRMWHLLSEAAKDIVHGDWFRIRRKIKVYLSRMGALIPSLAK